MDISHIDFAAQILKETAVICKNPSFTEENEVRLIYTPENKENEKNVICRLSEKLFRPQNGNIVPYYTFDFKNLDDFLSKIVLGSKCVLNKEDLDEYLRSEGFDNTKIKYSKSSYR